MVRDIKFRAWDIEENKMIIGNEKGLMLFLLMDECCVIRPLIKQKDDDWFLKGDFGGKYILMQYTGLKDKNGREIYEGDIVRVYGNPQLHEDFEYQATVEWIDYAKFQYKLKSGVSGDMGIHIVEIIGNTHDNPELLK